MKTEILKSLLIGEVDGVTFMIKAHWVPPSTLSFTVLTLKKTLSFFHTSVNSHKD